MKKIKRTGKKLLLTKDTVRRLSEKGLRQVAGATNPSVDLCGDTADCSESTSALSRGATGGSSVAGC